MESVFEIDEDFDLSDDESLQLSFFAQKRETKDSKCPVKENDATSTSNTNSNLSKFSNKQNSIYTDLCNLQPYESHLESESCLQNDKFLKRPYSHEGSKQNLSCNVRNTRLKPALSDREKRQNFESQDNFNDFDIPSDDSFGNDFEFNAESSATTECQRIIPNEITTNLNHAPVTQTNSQFIDGLHKDLSLDKNHLFSKRDIKRNSVGTRTFHTKKDFAEDSGINENHAFVKRNIRERNSVDSLLSKREVISDEAVAGDWDLEENHTFVKRDVEKKYSGDNLFRKREIRSDKAMTEGLALEEDHSLVGKDIGKRYSVDDVFRANKSGCDSMMPKGMGMDKNEAFFKVDIGKNNCNTLFTLNPSQLGTNFGKDINLEEFRNSNLSNKDKKAQLISERLKSQKFTTINVSRSSLNRDSVSKYPTSQSILGDDSESTSESHASGAKAVKRTSMSPEVNELALKSCRNSCSDVSLHFTPNQKRKFPGPAGLLPKLNSVADISKLVAPSPSSAKKAIRTPKVMVSPGILALRDDEDFRKPFWLNLQKQTLSNCKGLVNHSISTILKKASQNQLEKGKVPLLCCLIKVFSMNGSDASVVLKDPTGEIHGTVHKRVLELHQLDLCPGAGLILKQVSIFSPSAKKHYVNITPSNIILLLPAEQVSSSQDTQSSQAAQSSQMESREIPYPANNDGKDDRQSGRFANAEDSEAKKLESLFDEEDDFNSLLDDDDFLEEFPSEACS